MGARFTVVWASRPCGPSGWLALLLTKAGDVETNPGLTSHKRVWICDICYKQIHIRKQISIRCNRIEHWVHLRCAGIRQAQYTDTWTCHPHRKSRLAPHTDITTPHPSRPWSDPPTLSPPTPPTPPQPKHRHTSNTPPVPTGLVKSKPNPLINSPHSPPTPPRATHTHLTYSTNSSHSRTTLIHNTSAALYTIPEPRVPPTCFAFTTPHPSPTPATSHHHTPSADTHATQTTVHASQSPHPPHPHGYYGKLTGRPKTTTRPQTQHKYTGPAVKVRETSSYCRSTYTESKTNSRSPNCLFTTHMQTSSQFRKPSSP